MTISCIEEIYKKYVALAKAEYPKMFLEKCYTPHTMRHTTATHMLEAGVPIIAIKTFSDIPRFLRLNGTQSFPRVP